jgi:hypothetical protein
MKIWKQLLRPDIYYKTARGWFCPSKADCRDYVVNTKRALANKVPISVPLEHHLSADPAQLPLSRDEQMAAMVGLNTGFVDDLRINPDGSIDVQLDVDWVPDGNGQPIRDENEIKARLTKTIKFVSPYLVSDLADGHGNSYGKGIAHVALTAQPVDHGQTPFTATALGRGGLFLSLNSWRLSMPTEPKTAPTASPADAEPLAAPESTEHLLSQLKELIEAAEGDLEQAIRDCHEHLTNHHPDREDEDEYDGEQEMLPQKVESATPPTVMSRGAGRRAARSNWHGDLLASKFPRTTVPGLARNRNSH